MTESHPDRAAAAADSAAPVGSGGPRNSNGAKKRRFGGTAQQIGSALSFYKVLAYATGIMLLLVVVEMVASYGYGSHIVAGGSSATTGESVLLGFSDKELPTIIGGLNLSSAVLIVHGWMYVVYLIADFRLWSLLRWPFGRFVLIALGGVVPFLSFIVETRIHRQVEADLAAHPDASSRY